MTPQTLKSLVLTVGILSLAAACERKTETAPQTPAVAPPSTAPAKPAEPAPPEGFQHDPAFDPQGFYIPQTPIKLGTLSLRHIAFGAPSDFKQWESGERESVFGPVILYFEDESSPTNTNELGQDVHTVTMRILPTAYRMFPGAISFRATDPKLGEIGFIGAIDPASLAAAHDAGPGDSRVAMTGTLRVGEAKFENVRFNYFMGD